MTEYEYSRNGKLIRAVTTKDPRWTEQDRAEVLAYQYRKDSYCPCGCGQKFDDTTSDETAGGPEFRATFITCRARMAIIDQQDEAGKAETPYHRARLWSARKV